MFLIYSSTESLSLHPRFIVFWHTTFALILFPFLSRIISISDPNKLAIAKIEYALMHPIPKLSPYPFSPLGILYMRHVSYLRENNDRRFYRGFSTTRCVTS